MKYFAIGDIHGNLKALEQCIERSGFDRDNDVLIGIGDYVDGHRDSALVVEYLDNLPNFIGIMGNHDVWCMEWLEFGIAPDLWVNQGGEATLKSYIELNPELLDTMNKERHLRFFRSLHDYYILELEGVNYGFVHGGWTSHEGLGHENIRSNYRWDRYTWYTSFRNTEETLNSFGEVDYMFIGHTATTNVDRFKNQPPPHSTCNGRLINLDQGAGYSGKLTICDVQTRECWQSDSGLDLYGKSGR